MAEDKTCVFVALKSDNGNRFMEECAQIYVKTTGLSAPGKLTVLRDPKGKPYFPGNRIFVSYSHSAERAAAALSQKPVGVDMELKSGRNFEELSKRFCGEQLGEEEFYRRWVFAEAAFKALGGAVTDFLKQEPRNIFYFESDNYLIGVYSEAEGVPELFLPESL